MKKLVGVLAMLFTAVLALAGCVNMNAEVTVTGKDSASGAIETTVDAALLQGASFDEVMASQVDVDQLESMIGEEWTYSQVNNGNTVGLRFETVGKMNFVQVQDAFKRFELPVSLSNTEDGFAFNMVGNPPGDSAPGAGTATMTVSFPGAVTSSSATGVVEGNTVTFDMVEGAEQYSATGAENHALFYSIVFGGALLVLTLIIVLALTPKASKDQLTH